MKLSLQRHGGLTAGMRQPPCLVDDANLPPEQVAELRQLVREVETAATSPPSSTRLPDAQSYVIAVDDQGRTSELRGSDLAMSEPFARLLDWLEQHGSSGEA